MTDIGKWPKSGGPKRRNTAVVAQFSQEIVNVAVEEAKHLRQDIDANVRRVWQADNLAPVDTSAATALLDIVVGAKDDEVTNVTSIDGTTAFVHFLKVPEHLRRKGIGLRTYTKWEAGLPSNITHIEVDALPNRVAMLFWQSLGFIQKDFAESEFSLIKRRLIHS